ncbi:extracellular solute-binding protein [Ruegeria jejuensis]|uniref:extracellular solute-binding protein n=1 Tax=Ruegeria jejuensis TaxID=3233338 RepID=UPI00355C3EAA
MTSAETTTQLTGMTWDHPRAYECLIAASEAYAGETGITIDWDKRSLQAFADAPIAELAADYDLIVLDHPHVGVIAKTKCLMPLPAMEAPAEISLGGSVESYIWGGQTWAYPIDAACQMAVLRPDLGGSMPANWERFLDDDAHTLRPLTPLLPVDAFDMMLTLVAGQGEQVLPITETEFCSHDAGLRALHLIKRLYRLGPSEAASMNPIHVLEALSTTDDFALSPCLFGYINYAKPGFRPNKLEYVDQPVFKDHQLRQAILGGAGLGVSALRDNREAAQAFAHWVTSEPVQSGVYLDHNGQPAHLQTWQAKSDDPRYAGFLKGGFETIRTAWTRPRDPWFLGMVDDICEIFPAFFLKDQAEEGFLAQIQKIYRKHRAAS